MTKEDYGMSFWDSGTEAVDLLVTYILNGLNVKLFRQIRDREFALLQKL